MLDILAAFATVAPEMFAAEAAAATAAEIAAAEAAAAAAAEAAAASAAQQAAATTAAEAAATTAAQQANLGIQGLPQGFDQQLQNIQNMSQGPSVQVASANPAAGLESLQNQQPVFHNVGGQGFTQAQTFPVSDGGITSVPNVAPPPPAPNTLPMGIDMPGTYTPPSNALYTPPATTYTAPPPSALEVGMDKAVKFAKANPFTAMTGAYMGANALGLMDPSGATFNDDKYDGPLSRYRLSPDFKPGGANPADFQYTPRQYATGGGIMGADPYTIPVGYPETNDVPGYAKGGSLSDSIAQYQKMLDGKPQAAPARPADVGIYYDQDPDTRYQDALTAAQIRQAKVNQRAYVSPPAAKRPTPMGQLQMASVKPRKQGSDDVEAARGGIMQSYASGGITGDGNLNLQIPLNLGGDGGGGGGGGFDGYTPAGGGNVNPNTGGGGFGGFGGFGGMPQGLAGLFGAGQMQRMDDMDMYSHGPREFMEVPDAQNYQDVIRGRGNMLQDAQYRPERDNPRIAANQGGMGGYNPFTGRLPEFNPIDNRLHGGMGQGGQYMGFAQGGITSLGGYAAGGNPRLLKGPGDGMSDNIPATINGRQPARLADGEFVIPADVVSHLGNGSTEAGAKQLHAMMDRVRKARTGNKKQGKQIVAAKYLPKKKSA